MPGSLLSPNGPDPEGLLEYSVVYTDRALNHMSSRFQQVMNDISTELKVVYNAKTMIFIPGSGTYGMEALARFFGTGKNVMVLRNGYFSYRWTDIFTRCSIPAKETVLMAAPSEEGKNPSYAPHAIEKVVAEIKAQQPDTVFCPHVETASGILLPDAYLRAVADAVHSYGGVFVVDGIAAGCLFPDMEVCGIDAYLTAPQKGWCSPACGAVILLNGRATQMVDDADPKSETSFVLSMKHWLRIMRAYESGGHAYYATLPTDALEKFRDTIFEMKEYGMAKIQAEQLELGRLVRAKCAENGIKSVAADAFAAPGVAVFYTPNSDAKIASKFLANGMQIAGGVPLMIGGVTNSQSDHFRTFRLGLFGLEKLHDPKAVVDKLQTVLTKIKASL
jgi:aspartate aminotransferase-like enzyme